MVRLRGGPAWGRPAVSRHKEGGAWDWMIWFAVLLGIWGFASALGVLIHALP